MRKEVLIKKLFTSKNKTLSVAESCTGGLLCHRLTNVPGSSKYFLLGVVAYSNTAKTKILKVAPSVLKKFGAVSKETALQMARGVKKLANSDFALAITGIAGPTGGTKNKPIGTIFIAIVSNKDYLAKEFHFKGNRLSIKQKISKAGLNLLKNFLTKIE